MNHDCPNADLAWPLTGPTYRYFTNVEAARTPVATPAGSWGAGVLVTDQSYPSTIAERRAILAADPRRTSRLPHAEAAEWDALLFVLQELARSSPATMKLSHDLDSDTYRWSNSVTQDEVTFRIGASSALPSPPLTYAASQATEDLFVLDQRDNALHLEAIAATFTGAWSSSFSLGMTFDDLHGPVPRVHGLGMVDRTEKMILSLGTGEIVRRLNWSIYDATERDASLESAAERPPGRLSHIIRTGAYGDLRLRVEVQHLVKMPLTGAVLFTIAYQLAPLEQLLAVPAWAEQLTEVLDELPEDMAAYKNFAECRTELVAWLRAHR